MLWQAFSRFLKDFSNLDKAEIPELILWEHYLVYAVALGVAQKVIKQLPIVYPEILENTGYNNYGWFGTHGGSYNPSMMGDLADVKEPWDNP